jgi:hypothetical protein
MIRFLLLLLLPLSLFSQEKISVLPNRLKEISGLVFVTDDLMVGHNDGGNSPTLYFISKTGEVEHEVKISNADNKDWEDITFDGKDNLYIGDFGNNENKRQDLCIYVVSLKEALKNDKIEAKKIKFTYPDQNSFPPKDEDRKFDCEAVAFYKDTLYLFTKNRTEPWDGISNVYALDPNGKKQEAQFVGELYVGKNGWWQDAITAVDIQGDICYLLTYNRLMKYRISGGKLEFIQWIYLSPITQKESVAVNSKGEIYVADEQQVALGGGYLYKVVFPLKKKPKRK